MAKVHEGKGRDGQPHLSRPLLDLLRAGSRGEILRLLADGAMTEVGADGVVVVAMDAGGRVAVVEQRGAPALAGWSGEVDGVDAELGEQLRGCFARAHTLPMMSGGAIFGALVLLFEEPVVLGEGAGRTAQALVEIAASGLDKEERFEALTRSYAEVRASRKALERNERLRALGEMSAGIAHDLKNLLNPLSLYVQLLRRIIRRGAPGAEEAISEMDQVIHRSVDTVERFRAFSRQQPEGVVEAVDLDAVAREAIELSRPRIAATSRTAGVLLVEALGGPPPVRAQAAEMLTSILNLVVNSIDAMPDGGTVTVSTGARDDGAWVQVEDDGPGIPEDVQARIFDPFFSTKGAQGTGLGLSMVYAFVQRSGGNLSLVSEPARGARFTLWFPGAM